jgi:hypothetical protein
LPEIPDEFGGVDDESVAATAATMLSINNSSSIDHIKSLMMIVKRYTPSGSNN